MDGKSDAIRRERLDGLDLMKAVAILMVLSLHVPLWVYDFFEKPSFARVAQYALRLLSEGVPVFMMVNGYLMLRKSSFDLKRHLMKTLRLFLLLMAWCVILSTAGMVIDLLINHSGMPITLGAILRYTRLTQVFSKYTGPLWFLQDLIAVYLIYPILWMIYHRKDRVFEYLFVIAFVFTAGLNLVSLIRDYIQIDVDATWLSEWIGFFNRLNPLGNGWYLFCFMLGGILNTHQEWIQRRRIWLSVAGLLSWLCIFAIAYSMSLKSGRLYREGVNYDSVFTVVSLVGLFALMIPYHNRGGIVGKCIISIGKNTLGIYLTHFIFVLAIQGCFILDSEGKRLLAFLGVLLLSHVFSWLLGQIPGARRLVRLN